MRTLLAASIKIAAILALAILANMLGQQSTQAYSNSRIMDDAIFDNVNSMSEQQIRDFINSRPSTCLAQSGAMFPEPLTYWEYGGNVDAARVIYNAARYNDVNPQVILATLQKEQSLITRTDCFERPSGIDSRNKAMGMGCPDGGACPAPGYAGFHQQVMKGTWLLGYARHRAVGDVNWGGNGSLVYSGPMTRGNHKQCASCQTVYFDGYRVIDGQNTLMETGATASFYYYTPHLGQSLPGIFESWFGPTLVPTYAWQWLGQSSDKSLTNLPAGTKATLYLTARNTGTATWNNYGANQINLATSRPDGRSTQFVANTWLNSITSAKLNESIVPPGQVGTFTFIIQAPATPGTYTEYFNLVSQGVTWLNDLGLFWKITVVPPTLNATATSVSAPTLPIPTNSEANVSINVRNDSNIIWYNDDRYPIKIGTADPQERTSPFQHPSWLAAKRPAKMSQYQVSPGETATFTFKVKAPNTIGNYTEKYSVVAENLEWFPQTISVPFNVVGSYKWSWNAQATYTDSSKSTPVDPATLSPGQTAWLVVRANNAGTATWTNSGSHPVRVGTAGPLERSSRFATNAWLRPSRPGAMTEASVPPGQVGTFEFPIQVPAGDGSYREYFNLLAEDYTWMNEDVGQFFMLGVKDNYKWSWNAQAAYADSSKSTPVNLSEVSPGQAVWLVVRANNTGASTWFNNGRYPVRIGTANPLERTSRLATNSWLRPSRPATMVESSVAPGQTASFEFPATVPAGGSFREYFNLLAEDLSWMNEDVGQFFTVSPRTNYKWSWNAQAAYTNSSKSTPVDLNNLSPGQTAWLVVRANNTGTATWFNSGPYPTRIGTASPLERISRFANGAWLRPSRPGTMTEASVAPGQTGTFEFPIQAPSTPGAYREYFNPLAENLTWMNEDVGQFFQITVR